MVSKYHTLLKGAQLDSGPRAGKLQGVPGRSYTQKARKNLKDNEDMSEDTTMVRQWLRWPNGRYSEYQNRDSGETEATDKRNPGSHSVKKFIGILRRNRIFTLSLNVFPRNTY